MAIQFSIRGGADFCPSIGQRRFCRFSKSWNAGSLFLAYRETIFLFYAIYCHLEENNFIRPYSLHPEHGTMSITTNTAKTPRFSLDTWAVSAAVIFIVL